MKEIKKNSFAVKVVVALCGSAAFILLFNFLPLWVTAAMSTLVSVLIFYELAFNAKTVTVTPLRVIGLIVSAAIPWMIYLGIDYLWLFMLVFVSAFAAFTSLIALGENGKANEIINLVFCESIFQISISLMAPVLKMRHGVSFIIMAFISAWGTDAFAQIFGRWFGKTKFLSAVSPNKTLEGFISGIAGNAVVISVYAFVLNRMSPEVPALAVSLCGIICGLIAEAGDLFFSYIKRSAGIKDFGKFIAGHGGVLDRFDSVLFVLPVWYAFLTVFVF